MPPADGELHHMLLTFRVPLRLHIAPTHRSDEVLDLMRWVWEHKDI